MIPGLLASEVATALREFIVSGFETETEPFKGEFRRLVEEQQDGEAFLKGPYVSVGLPFLSGSAGRDFFDGFETDFPPYAHQEKAWQRLTSNGSAANTLVATGTGSGKTECFLYPVLDHCRRKGGGGIKAIVIYPMNALATDQAKRFAEIIHGQPALQGLRVGLFVGGDGQGSKVMGPEQVITDKATLRADPPDVLLTNYKMLDYLLMRPKDQPLWANNGPDTLRYLIVDELHTFDGAQGTDLSLLIRRLRARFEQTVEQLICVGTSATLGGEESAGGLLGYASDIFSSPFPREAVITEQRQGESEFLDNIAFLNPNPEIGPEALAGALEEGLPAYLGQAYQLYFSRSPEQDLMSKEGRIALGKSLRQHGQLINLLRQLRHGERTPTFRELVQRLASQIPRHFEDRPEQALIALLALMAHARDENGRPFVQLRLQLWSRELRRIVGALREAPEGNGEDSDYQNGVSHPPLLSFGDDQPPKDQPLIRLPLVQCRECHGTAWLTRMGGGHATDQVVETELAKIYSAFFANLEETTLLLPWQGDEARSNGGAPLTHFRVCRICGTTAAVDHGGVCPGCQADNEALVRVSRPSQLKEVRRGATRRFEHQRDCPFCAAKSALVVFGARAASLSSVAIHQLFSSRDNDDRKLLTFSDSVQDATHRAGFFAARTWHNNARMALTQLFEQQGEPLPLLELPDRFEAFWLNHEGREGRLPLVDYLREFMPPDKRYRRDFEVFEQTGQVEEAESLLRLIRWRMLWQALEDLCWRSQIGRSLNRLGLAALSWPLGQMEQAASNWARRVDNTLGYAINSEIAREFMVGLVQHLGFIGAIGLDDLRGYRAASGKAYLLQRIYYAPSLGPGSSRPRYPSAAKGDGVEQLVRGGAGHSWFERWLSCLNPESFVDRSQLEQVLITAMDGLVEVGLCREELTDQGAALWMLEPGQLTITTNVQAVEAPGHRPLLVPAAHAESWLGLPLLNASSPDRLYENPVPIRDSFYRRLFRHGEIHRVIAHEHTGLLSASERERVEDSFIKGQKPWELNLLSATPTLEMGIDIGDLSSVLLCSVPPAQANYLQRVGRGGRRDGNSFVLTVANGRPHDLVFYADPSRMLDAPVEPPAVFLKARHVLRRQLLAYAMDCWTRDSEGKNEIPAKMQPVLDAVENTRQDRFPYTFLSFLSEQMQAIWDGFSAHVATELSDDDRELLRQYLFGGPKHQDDHLSLYLLGRLKLVADERSRMKAQSDTLKKQMDKLRAQPQDQHTTEELEELERERAGFTRLRQQLNRRETLNFFTDEGLLPNYAFPEEGATLHSVIFRSEKGGAEGADREFIKREYEYQRPAQAALTEMAPESVFYAGNRKVRINRVETARGRNIQDWRFCPRCHYSASADDPKAGFNDPVCPRCQSHLWSDQSARTKMLKMTQVYAFTNAKDAQLDDYSDDRESDFFNKQMLIDFDPADVSITWVLEDNERPFGFEFIQKANFLEVNFGRRDGDQMAFEVAGEELQRSGFPVCRECGRVQPRLVLDGKVEAEHLKSCRFSRGPQKDRAGREDDGIENCLYLYRRFASEALRILLPRLSTGGTEAQVNSFVAALQLGLKRRFGGKVAHLRVAYQSEPVNQSDDRRHFVVLYDSVPGGTGYLQELLSRAEHMQEVFRMAYEVMAKCDCYGGTMDGCYRCLLEYRNAYGMESTSKALAMEMLKDVIDGEQEWVRADESLSALKANPWVDSELEARLPEAMAKFSGDEDVAGHPVRVSQDIIEGKHGYRVSIGDRAWQMEPQVDLGAGNGVQFASCPDFVLWPEQDADRPVAIFLDGYQYHQKIVEADLLKRQSLMHAGYLVWSLNWYDINQVLGDKAMGVPVPSDLTSAERNQTAITQLANRASVANTTEHIGRTSLSLLMHYLTKPYTEPMAHQALFFALQCLPADSLADPYVKKQVTEELAELPVSFSDRSPSPLVMAGAARRRDEAHAALLELEVAVGEKLLTSVDLDQVMVMVRYTVTPGAEEQARYQWQRLWLLMNFLQFLPLIYGYTPSMKHDGTAAGLTWPLAVPPLSEATGAQSDPDWFADLDEELADSLRRERLSWPSAPLVGDDVLDSDGEVIGEAELLFEKERVALLLEDNEQQLSAKPRLEAEGWQVVTTPEELVAVMHEQETGA